MDHGDHVGLIRAGVLDAPSPDDGPSQDDGPSPGDRLPVWADIGAGSGAFTLALADLLGPGATVIAVDRDAGALRTNAAAVARRFPATTFRTLIADLEGPLDLPPLDGLVAANSLHFVPRERQVPAVRRLAASLAPDGRFVVVEYDADRGNPWVPHPFSAATWTTLAVAAGLAPPTVIGRVPSRFLGAIYAAVSRPASTVASRSTSAGST